MESEKTIATRRIVFPGPIRGFPKIGDPNIVP